MDIICDDIIIYISHFLDMKSLLLYNSIDKYTSTIIQKDFVSNLLFINYYPLYKINKKKLNNDAYKYIGKKGIYDLLLSCFYSHCRPSTCCLKEHKRQLNHLGLAWVQLVVVYEKITKEIRFAMYKKFPEYHIILGHNSIIIDKTKILLYKNV